MINIKDYNEIGYNLQCFHEIFYKFWRIGEPTLSEKVKTCQVHFDKEGNSIDFKFNPKFWDSTDNYERAYFIAHECLHIILNHGRRAALNENKESKDIGVDLVVNQMMINNLFLFKTPTISENSIFLEDIEQKYGISLEKNRSFEYYYNTINQLQDKESGDGNEEGDLPINDHSYLGEDSTKVIEKAFGLEQGEIDNEDKNKVESESKQGGTETLDKIFEVFNTKTYRVPNWQFLFKRIVKSRREQFAAMADRIDWTRPNRRSCLLEGDILLPNNVGEKPKDKIEMWFFQDISGSCIELKDKFISLARKIPTNIFDIKYHTFDTRCREIPITTKEIVGGGGTNFQCIEEYILDNTVKKGLKYPEVVVHLTDGCSSVPITPLRPLNHFWLLTEDCTGYIPKESFRLVLDDFRR